MCALLVRHRYSVIPLHADGSRTAGHNHCLLDNFSRSFVTRYPSVEAMQSGEAMAVLESAAVIALPTTAKMERSHAETKRNARTREETHAQQLLHTSSASILAKLRGELRTWQARALREDEAVNRLRRLSSSSTPSCRESSCH